LLAVCVAASFLESLGVQNTASQDFNHLFLPPNKLTRRFSQGFEQGCGSGSGLDIDAIQRVRKRKRMKKIVTS
jgi:hypothetical protein